MGVLGWRYAKARIVRLLALACIETRRQRRRLARRT
jgi:hypothetical protein